MSAMTAIILVGVTLVGLGQLAQAARLRPRRKAVRIRRDEGRRD